MEAYGYTLQKLRGSRNLPATYDSRITRYFGPSPPCHSHLSPVITIDANKSFQGNSIRRKGYYGAFDTITAVCYIYK
jgi:hypothetical protein